MKYRDNKGRYTYRDKLESELEGDGSFQKASDSVLYTWAPTRKAQKSKWYGKLQYFMATVIAFFISLSLLFTPSDLDLGFVRQMVGSIGVKDIVIVFGFIAVLATMLRVVFDYLNSVRSIPSSFVELDERSNDKRMDIKLQMLEDSMLELKSSFGTEATSQKEDARVDDAKTEFYELSSVEHYIHGITKSLDRHIELSEKKASKLLDTGTMYLRRGIYFYVASIFVWQVVAHVWGVDKQLIFGVVSCSLTFLVVEFLAAWFLKQYRSFIDSSIQFMRVKSVFDRYLLSYYAVKEFSNEESEGLAESKAQVLKVLAEEIKWPEALNTKAGDMNHMVQMFDSLAGVLEKMKKVSAKNEKAED